MPLGTEVGLGPRDVVLDGTQLPSPEKGRAVPLQFGAHVCCGQTAGWIKMLLVMEVGLGPGHMVLAPPPKGGHSSAANFRPILLWSAGWIKMPLHREVDLGLVDSVRWGPSSP